MLRGDVRTSASFCEVSDRQLTKLTASLHQPGDTENEVSGRRHVFPFYQDQLTWAESWEHNCSCIKKPPTTSKFPANFLFKPHDVHKPELEELSPADIVVVVVVVV
ncbi:hypothetical protein LSH36_28g07007 [Paralvinella palmiformis]|uniref:Uncharacterized protein n=1 Tax=Paralvinella palmiformis TaxID=53620 RepID=A0AAD9K994_9ANNE|nr:hypothetical protein LSH36_28g07007 [Paralvinella palmiformis]